MAKRIAAWVGIIILVIMYIVTFISAIMATPAASELFSASLGATIIIPVVLWVFIRLYERAHKDDDKQMTMSEYRKINKRIKKGENPEDIAKEIDKKYRLNKTEEN